MTGLGRYMLNVPGNGDTPCFIEDPFIRMQKWGANLMTNTRNLESDLLGLTRASSRDCESENEYKTRAVNTSKINYPSCESTITDQSRATHPAWMSRDLEQVNWYALPLNPQENTCMRFQNNLNTRNLERNNHTTQVPCLTAISPSESINYNPFVRPLGTTF
jgi:hypothetical protein